MEFVGRSGSLALFNNGDHGVIVDVDFNLVVETGRVNVLKSSRTWTSGTFSVENEQLAGAAITSTLLAAAESNGRMYTIPKGAQNEAKKALEWHKKNKGGTAVGMNTARTLAKGGQIGLSKVRHIAKYFPRHEPDKKGAGWNPGEAGFPSKGRVAWALWGGDAAWRWAKAIVESENKKSASTITASIPGYDWDDPTGIASDINEFREAYEFDPDNGPEFLARVALDGSGIDRLYKIDFDSRVYVWDDGIWEDLGDIDNDIYTYDAALDDMPNKSGYTHLVIDPDSAVVIGSRLAHNPYYKVSIDDIDGDEARMALDAIPDLDLPFIDGTMTAAGALPNTQPANEEYTPEERSQNASKQVRDGSGKFAKSGSRVVVNGNPHSTGTITNIDSSTGLVTVAMENGQPPLTIPAKQTEAVNKYTQTVPNNPITPAPVDVTGILAEPRTPINRIGAQLPGTLPAMTANDLHNLLNDWPSYVAQQRLNPISTPGEVKVQAPNSLNKGKDASDYIKSKDQKLTTDIYKHPLLKKWLKSRDSVTGKPNAISFNSLTAAGEPAEMAGGKELTPETSDVQPVYLAEVSPDDPRAVLGLISLVPASSKSTQPMTYVRKEGQWIRDETMLNNLKSASPPPVVPLDSTVLNDVLEQVDESQDAIEAKAEREEAAKAGGATPTTPAAAPAPSPAPVAASGIDLDRALTILWGPNAAMVAAGGLDRNRGGADKLRRYWTIGQGGAKIRWGSGGDWTRCVRHLAKYLGPRAKGYCALRHKEMTGMWTGDKRHRQVYGRELGRESFSTDFVQPTSKILEMSSLHARANDARQKMGLTADAGRVGASFMIPLVIPEGIEAGDGRKLKKGALTIRDLPLPLLWQIKTADGHGGSVVVGRIDHMERTPHGVGNAYGVFDTGVYGQEAERLVREHFLSGVSADMDQFEATSAPEEDDEEAATDEPDNEDTIKQDKMLISKARIMAVTLVPKPAFQECKILLSDEQIPEEEIFMPEGIKIDAEENPFELAALAASAVVATAIPMTPPKSWFSDQRLKGPTPLTVDDDGRVYGHIAVWQQDHIGMAFGTKPPRSHSKYAYFHTGVVRTEEGVDMPVGQLTLAGGHASLEASAREAIRHYDDTASAIADVHAGEDAFGIWVAGSVRPDATPMQIRRLRASAPSGDWRPIKNHLELVAVCQVNVPGFPTARAFVASGSKEVYALVAAGAAPLAELKAHELAAQAEQFTYRATQAELAEQALAARQRMGAHKSSRNSELSAKAESLSARMRDVTYFSNIPQKKRDELAKKGQAMPDGSFPISNESDLKKAIRAYGRTTDEKKSAVRKHIMKRARALGKADLIPDNWKTAQSASITASLNRMQEAITAAGARTPQELLREADPKNLAPELREQIKALPTEPAVQADDSGEAKYTPKTQPRDEQGKFRDILARLRDNLGVSGNQNVIEKIKEADNLDNAGDYTAAHSAAGDLISLIDRMDSGALNASSITNFRQATTDLAKTIANLPLPFSNQAQKVRFSDLPPALRQLADNFVDRVEAKMPGEEGRKATEDLRAFMSGSDVYSQSEISSQMNRMLRLLT